MSIQLRVPGHLVETLLNEVYRNTRREPIVFALASHARVSSRDLVLVREVIVPPEAAFMSSNGHGARWKGAYTIELLNRALANQLGLFLFHAHPGSRHVEMSNDDRRSAGELLPKFQLVLPERAHGSIVLGEESVAGMVLMPGQDKPSEAVELRFVQAEGVRSWPLPLATVADRILLERQPFTENPLVREIFRGKVAAVVGLSGGGSQVVPYLAALGFGEICGIDNQTVDNSNLLASPNLGWIDRLFGLPKTLSAKLRAKVINRDVRFTAVNALVPERAALEALKRADVILGCVNNLHARADINEIAWRYCIPYVDIGLRMTVLDNHPDPKPLVGIHGNLFTAIPGGPCLWCAGFLNMEKLDGETGARNRSYLHGSEDRDAYVAPFNGALAGEAAAEVLRLFASFGQRREMRRQYDGLTGTLLEMIVQRRDDCPNCRTALSAGDPVWQTVSR